MTPQPKCPDCGVVGLEHLVSREGQERSRNREPWFIVVFCDECGHVYDVLAKHVFNSKSPPRFILPKDR